MANDPYLDLYLRASLNEGKGDEPPTFPRNGAGGTSPDIIPNGTTKSKDPIKDFGFTYDQDVGKPLVHGTANYIYIRGKNMGESTISGEVYSYWCKPSLVLWPKLWTPEAQHLHTKSGGDRISLDEVEVDLVGVGSEPFFWTPDYVDGLTDYSLVTRLVTDAHPNKLPTDLTTMEEYLAYVNDAPTALIRNFSYVDSSQTSFRKSIEFSVGAKAVPSTTFYLVCTGLTGCDVALRGWSPDPAAPRIEIKRTTVTTNPLIGVKVDSLPANVSYEFTYLFWRNGVTLSDGAQLSLMALSTGFEKYAMSGGAKPQDKGTVLGQYTTKLIASA